jgi:hypothetical protein
MSGTEIALVMASGATLITSMAAAIVSLRNAFNIQRIERNTNSISQRNEDIAKKLGIQEGRASEKANPSP